jgi:hypothetical protein
LEFGGFIVEFDGTRFVFHDTQDHQVTLDEADYPEAIPFMQRHAKWPLATQAGAAMRPRSFPIRTGMGNYRAENPRMQNTYLFQFWAAWGSSSSGRAVRPIDFI